VRHNLSAGEKGAHNLPLIILFGVILALLVAILFISLYDQQLNTKVDEQAESLADELAQAAFASLSGGQSIIELPNDLGGSTYAIALQENGIFVVNVTGGRRAGASYSAVVNAKVTVEDGNFAPGGRAYFMRGEDMIIMSASPIEAKVDNIEQAPVAEPPEFYQFSKKSPKEAAAIAAAYFDARDRYPGENLDVLSYVWEGTNSLLARIRVGSEEIAARVIGKDNATPTGAVEASWVVEEVESVSGILSPMPCPSPDEAHLKGWLYSPQTALRNLRSRTWSRISDNLIVVVPSNATIRAASATTNVSSYPVWKVSFDDYILFYQMLPWWELENTAGFVFQSSPELKPIV